MRYFLLKQDDLYSDAPYIKNWNQTIDVRNISLGGAHRLKHRILVELVPNRHVVFLDVLTNPTLMYSEKVKNVTELYNENIKHKQVVLLDSENMFSELYFMPILPVIDCLSDKSKFNLDHSIVQEAILIEDKIRGHSLFWLAGVKSKYTVIRLDLAESLLRRRTRGVKLIHVALERRQ